MLNDKIKALLLSKNLSPSRFADEIGVQRSSISHILSGRNKPSFDIIQKILRRFPELGMDWVMDDGPAAPPPNVPPPAGSPATIPSHSLVASPVLESGKEIEKILIFYKDKTFAEYKPSQG